MPKKFLEVCRVSLWTTNPIHHCLPDCDRAEWRRIVFVRIIPRGRKRFFALCKDCVQALLLWNEGWRLSLRIRLLPEVSAGQECPSSAAQEQ
jgi:hypothetical protein